MQAPWAWWEGCVSVCVRERRSGRKILTFVQDLVEDGVFFVGLDADALPAVAQGSAVVVGAIIVVFLAVVVAP